MGKIKRAIGLMSGTSMDGIDVAAIDTDGQSHIQILGFQGFPYPAVFRERLKSAVHDARGLHDRLARPGCLAEIERESTQLHSEAVTTFLATKGWTPDTVDIVGYHGQTVLHQPDAGLTVQLGDGQALADKIGIPVVYDLRAADVAAGGQGAPLAPVYHQALASSPGKSPIAVLNIGGVANVTWIGSDDDLVSFDTGPGNALVDDWVKQHTGQSCDTDGRLAHSGQVDRTIVERLLRHPYFSQHPPKSLDRDAWKVDGLDHLSLENGAATLTACTAETIAAAEKLLPSPPAAWIVCGGGRHNQTLMAMLASLLSGRVMTAEDAGWNGDAIEAEAWAYLAVRSLEGLPITFPGTTGVVRSQSGGVLCQPSTNQL